MIEIVPEVIEVNGRRIVRISVRDGDRVLDADTVNPANATQRHRVAKRLAEYAGDAHGAEQIEAALLACLPLLDAKDLEPVEPEVVVHELQIARAELIVRPDLCGIAIPEVVVRGDSAEGRWRLYLCREGNRRESVELPPSLALREGQRLWFSPVPAPPPVPALSAWSAASRAAFLAGCEHPRPMDVFLSLCAAMDDYLELPAATPILMLDEGKRPISPAVATLALWTMLSYCYMAWDAVPYLYVGGPAGSGKTRVFELLSRLAFRPIVSSNLSAAALFRTLHDRGGMLLLDEAERLNDGGPEMGELRSILLAGYRKGGRASRLESAGDGFAMTEFQVFGPKAVACINSLPGPLASRCIPLPMLRAQPESPKPRRRIDQDPQRWQTLRDQLHLLTLISMGHAAASALVHLSDACPLSGRNYELWQPLLSLADWVDADGALDLAKKLAEYAKSLVLRNQEELAEDADQTLLRCLCEMVREGKSPISQEVLVRARRIDADTFAGRSWTPRRVSEVLRRYGFVTTKVDRRREFRNLRPDQFAAIERNYGFDLNSSGELRFNVVHVRSY